MASRLKSINRIALELSHHRGLGSACPGAGENLVPSHRCDNAIVCTLCIHVNVYVYYVYHHVYVYYRCHLRVDLLISFIYLSNRFFVYICIYPFA